MGSQDADECIPWCSPKLYDKDSLVMSHWKYCQGKSKKCVCILILLYVELLDVSLFLDIANLIYKISRENKVK